MDDVTETVSYAPSAPETVIANSAFAAADMPMMISMVFHKCAFPNPIARIIQTPCAQTD